MWQRTFGRKIGAYARAGDVQLYVRLEPSGWWCFIDGTMTDRVRTESEARRSLEQTLRRRGVIAAGASRMAAAARKGGGPAEGR